MYKFNWKSKNIRVCPYDYIKHCRRGFSLVEVLFSIIIISAGLLSVLPLISSSLTNSFDSRNQTIAGMLAQEGLEIVVNARDNNWKKNLDAFDGFPGGGTNCWVDYNYNPSGNLCSGVGSNLFYSGDYYTTDTSGEATRFQRKVNIIYGTDQADVTSMVIWGDSFQSIANCNTLNKCSYTQITLTDWWQ